MNIDNDEHSDSIGWQIVQKHAPFFKPSDLAKAIDDALAAQRQSLKDEVLKIAENKINGTHSNIRRKWRTNVTERKAMEWYSDELKAELRTAISTIFEGKDQPERTEV